MIKKHEAEVLSLEEDKVRLKRVCSFCVVFRHMLYSCELNLDKWHLFIEDRVLFMSSCFSLMSRRLKLETQT